MHHELPVAEFKEEYLQSLLDKISYINKKILLLGDFKKLFFILKRTFHQTKNFHDKIYSNSLTHKIIVPTSIVITYYYPTRLTTRTKTLSDSEPDKNPIAGSLANPISD